MELLRSGRPVDRLWVAQGAHGLTEVLEAARSRGAVIQVVPRAVLHRLAGTEHHQGVVARATPLGWVELEALLQRAKEPAAGGHPSMPPMLVVLDRLQDPRNVGALLRSADAAGAVGAVVASRRAAPLSDVAVRASAGAAQHLPVARVSSVAEALERIKEEGFWAVGADPSADRLAWDVDMAGQAVAVVVGAEGKGLSPLVRRRCDVLVRLPMLGKVGSLNASVAGAVLMYEMRRQHLVGQQALGEGPARRSPSQRG
ncbi:MAG: 23S rRNA (guanosine(2251)-2'-O)-methyltransferase RlmB [Limnochordaceae bacterium]|nr:23S rRNA (guanosine(2251)-2'-O)-methyltransferase RlmB [Limnochordaceae bacterium]